MKITITEARARMAVHAAAHRLATAEVRRLTKIEDRVNPGKPLLFGQVHRAKPWSPALLQAIADADASAIAFNRLAGQISRAEKAAASAAVGAARAAETRSNMCDRCFQVRAANDTCGCS